MIPSATQRGIFPLIALLIAAFGVQAQRVVMSELPASPAAKEALFGSVSPDGRSFVYEVIEGEERLLWRLDLASLRAERLTPAAGLRHHPVWSPNSKTLAYWRGHARMERTDSSDGLYVLDLDSRAERRLVESGYWEARYSGDVAWLADGRVMYWHMTEQPGLGSRGSFELAAVRADGEQGRIPPTWIPHADGEVISRSGTQVAYIDSCCGGTQRAIAVRDAAGARCLAGPVVSGGQLGRPIAWTRDEKRLYFIAHTTDSSDRLDHAYAIDIARGRAWRIGPPNRTIASVSVSDAGDVALTVLPERGRRGSLLLLPAVSVRAPAQNAERLENCPPMEKSIADFVRRAHLPAVHWIYPMYEDSTRELMMFSVAYGGACDIYSTRTGVRYGSRVGWIELDDACLPMSTIDSMQHDVPWFRLRPSDSYLFSDSLATRLKNGSRADGFWRLFLIKNVATPFDVIVREVRVDPHRFALVALQNPVVALSDTIPFNARLKMAALEDTLAGTMVQLPSVRDDPERLTQITDLPLYRTGEGLAASKVYMRMRELLPSLIARVQTLSERAALRVYMVEELSVSSDSLRSALLHALTPKQRRVPLALAATGSWSSRRADSIFARETLEHMGTDPEREMRNAILRVRKNELPGSLPTFMMSDVVHAPWSILDLISHLDERFRPARNVAALKLASAPSTPDSVISVLTDGLSRHRDPALAQRLRERPHSDTSRALLRALSDLESIMDGKAAIDAREKLAKLQQANPSSVAEPHETSPPAAIPVDTNTHAQDAWMSTEQCRTPDDWSEQLRIDIGHGARLLTGHLFCNRAAAALDSAFELPAANDSVYVFGVGDDYVTAFPPSRANAEVTLVRFDSSFVERSRRVIRVH